MEEQEKRKRGRPRTVNRERAIELAMESYWRSGLFELSVNELCRRAGISKPALYREFGGEDGLMDAALALYRQRFVVPLLGIVGADQPFAETLEQLVLATTTERDTPAGCLFTAMRLAQPRLGPATAERLRAIVRERRVAFEDAYRKALARGEAEAGHSPEFASRYLDTQLTTVLVHMGSGEAPAEVRAQAQLALRMLLPDSGREN